MSLSIVHSTGTRTLAAYQLADWDRAYALSSEMPFGATDAIGYGDRLPVPSAYSIRATITGASLAAAYQLAFVIITEANSASSVTSYEGQLLVNGITNASVEVADHSSVLLSLSFAPTKAEFEP